MLSTSLLARVEGPGRSRARSSVHVRSRVRTCTPTRPPCRLHVHGDAARVAAALLRWRLVAAARAAPRVARRHVLHRPLLIRREHRFVAEPNPPMHRTRTRVLLCCETLVHGAQVRAGDRGIRLLVRRGLTVHHPTPRKTSIIASGRGPRVLAASGVSAASRSAASVRFTPSRAPSLSPRRASLWPALPPPNPQRRPARCGVGPPHIHGAVA